jgi:hypothetical protein
MEPQSVLRWQEITELSGKKGNIYDTTLAYVQTVMSFVMTRACMKTLILVSACMHSHNIVY